MTFSVEAFIKEHGYAVQREGPDVYLNKSQDPRWMTIGDVRALVAQLLPPGHAVVERQQIQSVIDDLRFYAHPHVCLSADALESALSPIAAAPEQKEAQPEPAADAEFESAGRKEV